MHTLECLPLFFETVGKMGIQTFIELGSYKGGLALALGEVFGASLDIFSVDAKFPPERHSIQDVCHNICFHKADILNSFEGRMWLRRLIRTTRPQKLLYCDNGNKIEEINFFAQYLKPGDFLGVHDWLSRGKKDKDPPTTVTDPDQVKWTLEANNFAPFLWNEWEESELPESDSRFWVRMPEPTFDFYSMLGREE